MTELLQRAAERVQDSMDDILSNFKAGAKITVLVRFPDRPTGDFCMTDDDLDEVIAMVKRRKGDAPPPSDHVELPSEEPKVRTSAATGWSKPIFNDRIIKDGMPEGWFIQDRLDSNEALLCAPSLNFGSQSICRRPRAISTDDWLPTARRIAVALSQPPATGAEP